MRKRRSMNKNIKPTLYLLLVGVFIAVIAWYVKSLDIDILNPKGLIATKEYNLLVFTTILGFVVVIPVFVLAITIAWRYRESNTGVKYTPNIDSNRFAEILWWGIPIVLIAILSVVTWTSTHDLDPHKPLVSDVKPITVQVVALDWKWLFIYPEENIATVNLVQFPVDTPINFKITADAPMNSFWIPQLGGQIYAMAGMTTQLHLIANEKGDYNGSSANISGKGFAGMKFVARASSQADYENWLQSVKKSSQTLTSATYTSLAKPSSNQPVSYYASSDAGLYDTIVMKYMTTHTETTPENTNPAHDMSEMDHMNMDMQ